MTDTVVYKGKGCEVSIIEHSLNQSTGKDIITFQLRYWRAIHSELLTHRVFSRNSSSSRAIPTAKLLEQIAEAPAMPVFWGRNQPGMQAAVEHEATVLNPETGKSLTREEAWRAAAVSACAWASAFSDAGYHKQIVNRWIEPASFISTVLTSTEWANWYELRAHTDAQPEIEDLALTMKEALSHSRARILNRHYHLSDPRGWHLPYISMEERKNWAIDILLAMSAARCARVSYLTHDKQNPVMDEDITLYRRLVESRPLHASPLEHQALAFIVDKASRNLTGGWVQHRTLLEQAGSIAELKKQLFLDPV